MKIEVFYSFLLVPISFIYIFIAISFLNTELFDDYMNNISRIKELGEILKMPTLSQPYYLVQHFFYWLFQNAQFVQITTASISLSIYLKKFLDTKSYLLLINFLILPLTPVFFLSINRFALASSLFLIYIDISSKNNFLKKWIIFFSSFLIHIGPCLILSFWFINKSFIYNLINQTRNNIKKLNKKKYLIKILLFLSMCLIFLFFKIIFPYINRPFYQIEILKNLYFDDIKFDFLQSIYVLPICYLFVLWRSNKILNYELKNLLIVSILSLLFLSSFMPIFWRYWIILMPLVARFDNNKNNFIYIAFLLLSLYYYSFYI